MLYTEEEIAEAEALMTPWRYFLMIALFPLWLAVSLAMGILLNAFDYAIMALTEKDRKAVRSMKS